MKADTPLFLKQVQSDYPPGEHSVFVGGACLSSSPVKDSGVYLSLAMLNRHGLIAGATGTGKTKTLQYLAEEFSRAGIPSLAMDLKGDLSGMAAEGSSNSIIETRYGAMGKSWLPDSFPVEFLTLGGDKGLPLRATVTEFGPVLLSRILGLNDTQSAVIAMLFRYSDEKQLPLVDLLDLRRLLLHLTQEGKEDIIKEYGALSTASVAAINRRIIELEEQGADSFFGEPSFDINDLLRCKNGKGVVSMLRLENIQDKPKLFSTFMLCLLAEIYSILPEQGDTEKPRLVIFLDEAHLIFRDATPALLEQLEITIKLIRSKGVSVIFCTQSPTDIPAVILSQLGLKIQHALRAFTAADRKAIKLVSENYPLTDFYDTSRLLTELPTGMALVSALRPDGRPGMLVEVMMASPASRMNVLSASELEALLSDSDIRNNYLHAVNRESASEILEARLNEAKKAPEKEKEEKPAREEDSWMEKEGTRVGRQVVNTVARELTRGLLGVLGIRSTRRKSGGLF